MDTEYDVIIIGGGSAGENVAGRTGPAGLSTAIVEKELVGGECTYWACMPSKALLRPGEALASVSRVPGARQAVTGRLDVDAVLDRRDRFINHLDDKHQVEWVESVKTALFRGAGRLDGPKRVLVTAGDGSVTTLTARKAVVIATGTTANIPPIPGLDSVGAWDNRDITIASQVPKRLLIIGGGAVGVEMAQAWQWLGSSVTLVESGDRLLSNEEAFAGELLEKSFAKMGIRVVKDTKAVGASRNGAEVTLKLDTGGTVTGDELLVATGRRPATGDLGVDTIGLEPGKYLWANDQLQVQGVEGGWLYAVGDVNGRALLTHMGKYQGRMAGDHILGKDVSAWADHGVVPRVVFTDPQVAAVGLTEQKAKDQGLRVRAVSVALNSAAGASLHGQGMEGRVQVVVDEDKHVLVGATFVGPEVGEMLHSATIAIAGQMPLAQLWHAVPAFPTMSEVWLRLLEAYGL